MLMTKSRAWKEFGEAFWTANQSLGREKKSTVNTGGDGVLLTSTQDIVDWWHKYFEDLLNPTEASRINLTVSYILDTCSICVI